MAGNHLKLTLKAGVVAQIRPHSGFYLNPIPADTGSPVPHAFVEQLEIPQEPVEWHSGNKIHELLFKVN